MADYTYDFLITAINTGDNCGNPVDDERIQDVRGTVTPLDVLSPLLTVGETVTITIPNVAPTPPGPPIASPGGSQAPPIDPIVDGIIDGLGRVWTLDAMNKVFRDGIAMPPPFDFALSILMYNGIWLQQLDHRWMNMAGTIQDDPRVVGETPPPTPENPNPTPPDPPVINPPGPIPIPNPDPPPPPTPVSGDLQMIGGWIAHEEWSNGSIAIDFATNRLWVVGHDNVLTTWQYNLPSVLGTGDPSTWPVLSPVGNIPKWWPNIEAGALDYANGIAYFRNKLWASPRIGYAISPAQQAAPMEWIATDGERIVFPTLGKQKFSGFVKRPGQEPLVGCGGYCSGQTSASGPSLAEQNGTVRISYEWPALPGAGSPPVNWNLRAPRDPNYWPIGHADQWVAWEPRNFGSGLEGRWASDNLFGGGLLVGNKYKYWPLMGFGELSYATQAFCFALPGNLATYEYTYNASTYAFESYAAAPMALVLGQEIAPDGTVYLAQRWINGNFITITVWRVF